MWGIMNKYTDINIYRYRQRQTDNVRNPVFIPKFVAEEGGGGGGGGGEYNKACCQLYLCIQSLVKL